MGKAHGKWPVLSHGAMESADPAGLLRTAVATLGRAGGGEQ